GNIVFAASVVSGDTTVTDTFLWTVKTQKVTPVALRGMPAVNNLTFETGGDFAPVIDGSDQIAFLAGVDNGAAVVKDGLFFLTPGGGFQAIVLPDQRLPDGHRVDGALAFPTLNDR